MKIHTIKTFRQDKIDRYEQQNGLCPMCGRELNPDIMSNHLDHDHDLDGPNAGKVRGLLCNLCNSLEGQVKHKFNRSGLKSKDVDMIDFLKNLVKYLELDNSDSYIHPKYIPDKVKQFSRLNRGDMLIEMDRLNFSYSIDMPKKDIVSQYRSQLKKALK